MKILFSLFLLIVTFHLYSQDKYLTKAEICSDLREYIKTLKENHIGLYRYTTKKEFRHYCDSISKSLPDDILVKDFYKHISRINAKICCGHSRVELDEWWREQKVYIPFSIYSTNNKVYVLHDLTNTYQKLDNREIISINGIEIKTILAEIRNYMAADGFIETRKRVFSENLFPLYYSKYFKLDSIYEVVLANESNTIDTLSIPASTYKNLFEVSKKRYLKVKKGNLQLMVNQPKGYAYFNVNSFYVDTANFKSKTDSVFKQVKVQNITNLIIDLRGNTGGKIVNEYHLLSYLVSKDIKTHITRKYLTKKGRFKEYKEETISSKKDNYSGNLVFLMDGYSFSAAGELLSIAQYYKLGTLIGEETGAAQEGCNYGGKKLTLSHSKIKCSIPYHTSKFNYPNLPKGRGVFPDYPIVYTKNDVIKGRDVALDFAISLIYKK